MRIHWLALLPFAWLGVTALVAADTTVWRIGKFDHTSAEFHGAETDVASIIEAGAPDAASHWPASQAGSGNAKAGSKAHPRSIRFTLDQAPTGAYTLHLNLLVGNPRLPHLELDVNGTKGSVYLDRHLTYFAEGRQDSPINGEAQARVTVPAGLLRRERIN